MQMVRELVIAGSVVAILGAASPAAAQSSAQPASVREADAATSRFSFDVALGIDKSISGNINSSGIGTLNDQVVVVLKNSYENVYGTGLHFRFGGGYMVDAETEVRVTFTLQSLDADLTPMGDIGASKLYGQYQDYQSFGLDVGFRRYVDVAPKMRVYGEGTVGLAFIDETDVVLVAPSSNLAENATDFYDKTSAFTLGGNAGLLFQVADKVGVYGQLGLRYVTGMSSIDGLEGTGLETINTRAHDGQCPSSPAYGFDSRSQFNSTHSDATRSRHGRRGHCAS